MTEDQRKKYEEAANHHMKNHRSFHSSILLMQEESFFMGCEFASQDTEERLKVQLSQYAYERDKARQERDQAEERVKQAHNGAIDSISKLIREKSFSFTEEEIQKLKL